MNDDSIRLRHLGWIPAGAAVGFLAAFLLGDRPAVPVDLYYLLYFAAVIGFFAYYARKTALTLWTCVRPRLGRAIVLGALVGWIMVRHVLSRPPTDPLTRGTFLWALVWRGVIYGAVDGLLLFAFPWIVTWRSVGAERGPLGRKLLAGAVAWTAILLVTTVYHLGYADFRSRQILQPNIGSGISALPTVLAANPVASPISHVMMHVAAVVHVPRSELFLPPHRPPPQTSGVPPGAKSRDPFLLCPLHRGGERETEIDGEVEQHGRRTPQTRSTATAADREKVS